MRDDRIYKADDTITRRYHYTLIITISLAIISYITLEHLIDKVADYSEIINISGRQRMLSQRITLFNNKLVRAENIERYKVYRSIIESDLALFTSSHERIKSFSSLSERNTNLLYSGPEHETLDWQVNHFIDKNRTILTRKFTERESSVDELAELNDFAAFILLGQLDKIVENFEYESRSAGKSIENIERSMLIATWICILLISTFLFRPLIKRSKKDISSLIAKTSDLDADKSRLQTILHTIVDGVFTTDCKGNIAAVNPAIESISGYKAKELIGKPFTVLFHKSAKKKNIDFFDSFVNGGNEEYLRKITEQLGCRKNGESYPAEVAIDIFETQGEKFLVGTIRDISKRKQLEETIEKTKNDALTASKAKSEFLAAMSHEIRTPMNGILGMTGLLMETNMTQKQRHYAKSVLTSANNLLDIINDILDLSKIEADKLSLEEIPLDLEQIINEIAEMMSMSVEDKGLEIITELHPDLPKFVKGDSVRIRQILNNLMSNAVKFTKKGHIHICADHKNLDDGNYEIRIAVTDTGIGIPKDKLSLIFNKFDQADMSTTRKFGGTGLGLAICKRLANMMGGEVHVESDLGKGTKFWFTIQLQEAEPIKYDECLLDVSEVDSARILLVDDDPVALRVAKAELEGASYKITTTDCIDKALKLVKDNHLAGTPYDLVITDYAMPRVDGISFGKLIRGEEKYKDTLLMLLTSTVSMGKSQYLKKEGFNGYLLKPLKRGALKVMASKLLAEHAKGKKPEFLNIHKITVINKNEDENKLNFTGMTALIAEDNFINQQIAIEVLKKYDITVTAVNNGKEAFEIFQKQQFDIILMDCHMPEMDGFEASVEIRKYEKDNALKRTPIVAFTASVLKSDLNKCLDFGMDDYLTKPISKDALETVLQKWQPSEKKQAKASDSALHLPTFESLKEALSDAFENTVHNFIQSSKTTFEETLEHLAKMEKKKILGSISPMLSSARQLGATELVKLGEEIEEMARKGKRIEEDLISELEERISASIERLEDEMKKQV